MSANRLVGLFLLLAASLPVLGYLQPHWSAALGFDWQAGARLARQRAEESQRALEVDYQQAVAKKRLLGKEAVIAQLLEGEMTLFEAAAWFRHLCEEPPDCPEGYRANWPGESDEEKLCRQVISWAQTRRRLRSSPGETEEESCRLEQELREHRARHGRVVLPEL